MLRSNKKYSPILWQTRQNWRRKKFPNVLWVFGTWDQAPSAKVIKIAFNGSIYSTNIHIRLCL